MVDITRFRGDTVADVFNIQDSAGKITDITGFTFILTVNSLENPPTNVTELYNLIGVITDALKGVVEFVPSAAQANQAPAVFFYDVQMIDTATRIKTIAKGKYTYNQDLTK